MTVPRYDSETAGDSWVGCYASMTECEDGDWVKHSDYAALEARLKGITDEARESMMLGMLDRLLDPDSGDGAVLMTRVFCSWHDAVAERDRYREALEWIAGKENHAAGLEINSRLRAKAALAQEKP